jgi:hypothetical protein
MSRSKVPRNGEQYPCVARRELRLFPEYRVPSAASPYAEVIRGFAPERLRALGVGSCLGTRHAARPSDLLVAGPQTTPEPWAVADVWPHHLVAHAHSAKLACRLPLTTPVPAAEWRNVWQRARAALCPEADPACKDPSRAYRLSSHSGAVSAKAICHTRQVG